MTRYLPILVLALAPAAFGQVAEFWIGAGQSVMTNNGIGTLGGSSPNDVKLTDGFRINFRMALSWRDYYGYEIGYAYNRSQLDIQGQQQGMGIHQGMVNFLAYPTKEGSRIRPFATGGIHFSNFVPPGSSATSGGGQTKFGFNYGGGLKVKLTSMFGIRFDFRQYNTGKPFDLPLASGRLRQNEISAAFGILL